MGTKSSSPWSGDVPSDASSNTSTSTEDLLAARIESDESESADDTASPIASDDLLVQNPNYWRLGDAECQDMFLAIQCMQNGLRDHEVDLTGYKYPGSDNAVVFITERDIDQIKPREADWQRDDTFLLRTQKEALMGQLNALLEVWNDSIGNGTELEYWKFSTYNPLVRPPNQDKGKSISTADPGEGPSRTNASQDEVAA
jgi:hypothetical protein